jgi:hypothetical protein
MPSQYDIEKINQHCIPIYVFKKNEIFNCGNNILDYIDFKNNAKSQYVNLEVNEKYIGFTKITPIDTIPSFKNSSPFEFMEQLLILDNKEIPILGADINAYVYKERLEKNYFTFYIDGIFGMFILKDNVVYFVKMENNNKNNNWENFQNYLEKINPEYIEINKYFYENFSLNEINAILNKNSNFSDSKKKCSKKNIKNLRTRKTKLNKT